MDLSLPLGAFHCQFYWSQETSWGHHDSDQKPTRHFYQEFDVDGKKVKCLCVEATPDFPVYRHSGSIRLSAGPQQTALIQFPWQKEIRGQLTLRLSPDCNWYYVKIRLGKLEAGPGWRQAPSNLADGRSDGCLHWTDWHEEYRISWSKRIDFGPGGGLGELFIGPPRKIREK
jgi:hypothetical protein